jgi:hypothetical protein
MYHTWERNEHKILIGELERKILFGDVYMDRGIVLKWMLQK